MRNFFFPVMLGTAILTTSSLFAMHPQDNPEKRDYKKTSLPPHWESKEREGLGDLSTLTRDSIKGMLRTEFSIPELGVFSKVSKICMELGKENQAWEHRAAKLVDLRLDPKLPAYEQIKSYCVTLLEGGEHPSPLFLFVLINSPFCPYNPTARCFKTWGDHWHITSKLSIDPPNVNEQDKQLNFKEFSLKHPVKFSLLPDCPKQGQTCCVKRPNGTEFSAVCKTFRAQIHVLIDDKGQRAMIDQGAIDQKIPAALAVVETYANLPIKSHIGHYVTIKKYTFSDEND